MSIDEMKAFIATASYMQLLHLWRFEPIGSNWFAGEVGKVLKQRMDELYDNMSVHDRVNASKSVGWGG
jgi:hypothetical protein